MAIDESSPARLPESAQVSGGPDELRALLAGYTGVLATIDDEAALLWHKLERPRVVGWVRVPASRALVRALVVRHVSRCVSALKRSAASRAALADDAPEPQRDLKMLRQFKQSLPTGLRLAVIWPMGLLTTLLVAYILANYLVRAPWSRLLADLTTASVNLDRMAAINAFRSESLNAGQYLGAVMVVAWSVALVIVPLLLPAFAVKRRSFTQLTGLEEHSFAALGARRVYDVELDLVAQLMLVASLALFGILVLSGTSGSVILCVILVAVAVLACVELRARYGMRRGRATRWHGRLTRFSLLLAWVLSLGWLIGFAFVPPAQYVDKEQVGEKVGGRQLAFTVTAIQQDAACADPYRPLKAGEQFLRVDLDVSSTVDQFADPRAATELAPRHWGVVGSDGVVEKNIYMYAKCGDGTEAIAQRIVPGTHIKTVVVINAPKQAVFLQLDKPNSDAVWRWPIPPAGS
jgi:hypothetical protein